MRKTKKNVYYDLFIGEMVSLILKVENSNGGGMVVEGVVLEIDDDHIYVGQSTDSGIEVAVKKDEIAITSILRDDPGSIQKELLKAWMPPNGTAN